MANIEIEFYRKNNYGQELCYFANEDQAHQFKRLTGRKTFSEYDQNALAALIGQPIEWREVVAPRPIPATMHHIFDK